MEGGLATTNDLDMFQRMQRLRTHGITREPELLQQPEKYGWYYEQQELGLNYRITDVQAALGSSQLKRVNENIARRRFLAERYKGLLASLPVSYQKSDPASKSSWHLFVIRLLGVNSLDQKSSIFDSLRSRGIGVNVHYIPVHTQPYYKQLGFDWGMFPEAESYYTQAISIPLFPELKESEQDYIVEELKKLL